MDTPASDIDSAYQAFADRLVGARGPFELIVQDTLHGPMALFRAGPHTLAELIGRARVYGDRAFMIEAETPITYAQISSRAGGLANLLTECEVKRGDRVILAADRGPAWVSAFLALVSLGAVPVLIDPANSPLSTAAAEFTDARLAVSDQAAWRAPDGLETLVIDETTADAPLSPVVTAQEDLALITYTSGSSGVPKGVLIENRALMSGLRSMMLGGALLGHGAQRPVPTPGAPPTSLVTAPLFHIGGYAQVLLALMSGARLVFAPGAGAEKIATLIETYGLRSIGGMTPLLLADLVDAACAGADLSSLTAINIQGAAFPTAVLQRALGQWPGVRFSGGYGMTESNGTIAIASHDDLITRPGVYRPLPSAQISVAGPGMGEIVVRGPMIASGYAGRLPFEEGRLTTGDIGRIEAEGRLHLLDRRENCLRIDGEWISAAIAEGVALAIGEVREALATIDSERGEISLHLAPWLGTDPRPMDIQQKILAALPILTGRLNITIQDQLARTASGKVSRSTHKA